jgi:sugar phosphate isomerase/epimerase
MHHLKHDHVPFVDRRTFIAQSSLGLLGLIGSAHQGVCLPNSDEKNFRLNYCLPSCMYGKLPLEIILPEISKIGATSIDLWPKPHGDQREQAKAMGWEKLRAHLEAHDATLGCLTRYDLGPFGLKDELKLAGKMNCSLIVTGGKGPAGLTGTDLKHAVRAFVEKLKPHLDIAVTNNVTISIENHANNLIHTPDSLRWLAEFAPNQNLGIALAPYHLETLELGAGDLAGLIRDIGPHLSMFYAWQHGKGCMKKLPKEEELLQMPGRGDLDFAPILSALKSIDYQGLTEIFMHPVPRGIPILPTAHEVTQEMNRARTYLESRLNQIQ